eukprot:scaffold11421_cov67-Phaeocystis_antarctica.AAC.9
MYCTLLTLKTRVMQEAATQEAVTQESRRDATLARQTRAPSIIPMCACHNSVSCWAIWRALPKARRAPRPMCSNDSPLFSAGNGTYDMMLMSSSHSHFSGILTIRKLGRPAETALIVRGLL